MAIPFGSLSAPYQLADQRFVTPFVAPPKDYSWISNIAGRGFQAFQAGRGLKNEREAGDILSQLPETFGAGADTGRGMPGTSLTDMAAVGQPPPARRQPSQPYKISQEDKTAVWQTAQRLGMDPTELAGLMSYETGGTLNPNIWGGKGGRYLGGIQFSPENQRRYGIRPGMTLAEQMPAIERYFRDRGWRPGMGLAEAYSIVNAGSLDRNGHPRWNASDGNGTVRTHVSTIQREHIPRTMALFRDMQQSPAAEAATAMATGGDMPQAPAVQYGQPSLDSPAAVQYGAPQPIGAPAAVQYGRPLRRDWTQAANVSPDIAPPPDMAGRTRMPQGAVVNLAPVTAADAGPDMRGRFADAFGGEYGPQVPQAATVQPTLPQQAGPDQTITPAAPPMEQVAGPEATVQGIPVDSGPQDQPQTPQAPAGPVQPVTPILPQSRVNGYTPQQVELLKRMLRNPLTRQFGIAMLQNRLNPANYEFREANGQIFALNPNTGEALAVAGSPQEPKQQNLINAGDGRLYDQNSGEWIIAPDVGSSKPPQVVTLLDANGREVKAIYKPDDPNADANGFVQIGGPKLPTGTRIAVDPATGAVTIEQGADMTTATQTNVQKDRINAEEGLVRLREIEQSFKPEYATLLGQAGNSLKSWRAWLFGQDTLSPEEQAQMRDYATWRSRTAANLNEYLHNMSGAAITPQEAQRLIKALPSENDDPVTFKAKLDEVIRGTREAIARNSSRLRGEQPNLNAPAAAAPDAQPAPDAMPPAPDGVDPQEWPTLWQHMTPEERALFQ